MPNQNKPNEPQGEPTEPQGEPSGQGKLYTSEELDAIIDKKIARWRKKAEKEADEAAKLAAMNAQEKAEYERQKLQEELDEFKRRDAVERLAKESRKALSEQGVSVPDSLLYTIVTDDAETTKANVDEFAQMFTAAVDAAVSEKLKRTPPKNEPSGDNPGSGIGVLMAQKVNKKYTPTKKG